MSETKACIGCFEPINIKALKCPHCHQIQTKAAGLVNHPAASFVAVVLIVGVFVYMFYMVYQIGQTQTFQSQLVVGESAFRLSKVSDESHATCFATIKNTDTAIWSRPSLQAEFFDPAGQLVDVHYAKESFELYPSFTAKGRVSGRANAEPAKYASCKITILSAQ